MKKVKVAVVGYGHLGRWHVQKAIAHEKSECVAIVEPFPDAQEKARAAHPGLAVVSSLDEIINDIDAAIVVTPTSFHHEVVEQLLKAGKHVFCEKPLTSTYEQSLAIQNQLEGKDLVLQVGHSERFHQVWDRKKDYPGFFSGKSTVRINRLAPFKGRATDVDVVQDLMIHDLDLLVFLMEEEPISVQSTGYKIRTDKWDYVSSDFHFSSGRKASIVVGRNHVKEIRDLEITNELGCLYFDLFANKMIFADGSASADGTFVQEFPYEKRDHLFIEQEHFYNSILTGDKAIVDIGDGVAAVKLISKVLESLESGSVVEI